MDRGSFAQVVYMKTDAITKRKNPILTSRYNTKIIIIQWYAPKLPQEDVICHTLIILVQGVHTFANPDNLLLKLLIKEIRN